VTKKMRVLHVYKSYFPETQGGLEEAIRQICLGTSFHGITNEVFTLAKTPHPGLLETKEARVWRSKSWFTVASCNFTGFSGMRLFYRLAREVDLVHYHYPWPFGDLLHLTSRINKPCVVTYHSDIVRQKMLLPVYRPIMRRFLDSAEAIVATSPNYALTSPVLQKYKRKVTVIPLGVDASTMNSVPSGLLKRWKERVGSDFFLFIGVFRYYKGLPYLIEAVRGTRLQVIIVGTGPEERKVRKLARDMENVRFVGAVDDADKFALLKLARCVVLPSNRRSEAFGLVLLEGAAFDKPLITTEIATGTSYVNIADETGLVVPHSDPLALRAAMQRLAVDDYLADRLGRANKQRLEAMFTSKDVGKQYAELYARIK